MASIEPAWPSAPLARIFHEASSTPEFASASMHLLARISHFRAIFGLVLNTLLRSSIITAVLCFGGGCDIGTKHRPPGLFTLGSVAALQKSPLTVFPELKIAVRYDVGGFSAMSTACTSDLSPLVRSGTGDKEYWRSMYTTSEYELDGTVRKGPARSNLPYYEVRVAAGQYGGTPDTLFVMVGVERPREWRLHVP